MSGLYLYRVDMQSRATNIDSSAGADVKETEEPENAGHGDRGDAATASLGGTTGGSAMQVYCIVAQRLLCSGV